MQRRERPGEAKMLWDGGPSKVQQLSSTQTACQKCTCISCIVWLVQSLHTGVEVVSE
jgi:hypothetical protein